VIQTPGKTFWPKKVKYPSFLAKEAILASRGTPIFPD
jgi:hypothetical protein